MTDIILSSFISLFALFGKEEQVDERRAKEMLVSYLRRHFGIRNVDLYLDLYSDMRMAKIWWFILKPNGTSIINANTRKASSMSAIQTKA